MRLFSNRRSHGCAFCAEAEAAEETLREGGLISDELQLASAGTEYLWRLAWCVQCNNPKLTTCSFEEVPSYDQQATGNSDD